MKLRLAVSSIFIAGVTLAASLGVISALSRRNADRAPLNKVDYIILHTTEGDTAGSLAELKSGGKIHYMIDPEGRIYQIMREDRIARHSGRSMWNGRPRIDEVALGIEMVGYHNRPLTGPQEESLKQLLNRLKDRYSVPDDHVLTHSMVAYGAPNAWHKTVHRGRKRCGMLMADPSFRRRVGLMKKPLFDPDFRAKRLAVADPYLFSVLYDNSRDHREIIEKVYQAPTTNVISPRRTAWFIARERYDHRSTIYTRPDGSKVRGDEVTNWSSLPSGTKVTFQDVESQTENVNIETEESVSKPDFKEIGVHGRTAYEIAGKDYALATTIYFFKNGTFSTGQQLEKEKRYLLDHLPQGTKVLLRYEYRGPITKQQSAFSMTGKRWNSPATVYRLADGKFLTGDEVLAQSIPDGTHLFYEK